jgi:hypothetical protein
VLIVDVGGRVFVPPADSFRVAVSSRAGKEGRTAGLLYEIIAILILSKKSHELGDDDEMIPKVGPKIDGRGTFPMG